MAIVAIAVIVGAMALGRRAIVAALVPTLAVALLAVACVAAVRLAAAVARCGAVPATVILQPGDRSIVDIGLVEEAHVVGHFLHRGVGQVVLAIS